MREYDFCNNLWRILGERNMTSSQLARDMLVSRDTIQNWLCGNTNPRITDFYDMCCVLKVTPDELLLKSEGTKPQIYPLKKKGV